MQQLHILDTATLVSIAASKEKDLTSIRRALGPHHNPAMSLEENVAAVVKQLESVLVSLGCVDAYAKSIVGVIDSHEARARL